ncbi:hypothetical protein AVME950_23470 [Acidovorax sp. SUPP950]|uniref:hypothetical protein n=1 Tax=Acidovorax sp. SUPP950 TaxID=511901 RepID=UPI0023D24FD1|nr:hypothetical protein [Acidovorax sp. SUPP950]GKS77912.1 hypothetical protein AVME950_23470 [Acidovorax sp. SUPP950]
MKNIPDFILKSIANEPDYSKSFSRKISALAQSIRELTHLGVTHCESMDYCPAQYLEIYLNGQIDHPSKTEYIFEIRFYISSKADLFFVYINDKKGRIKNAFGKSHPISIDLLPEKTQNLIFRIKYFLIESGYQEVLYEFYDREAVGYLTQMDGLPANIFEALFAEIV